MVYCIDIVCQDHVCLKDDAEDLRVETVKPIFKRGVVVDYEAVGDQSHVIFDAYLSTGIIKEFLDF